MEHYVNRKISSIECLSGALLRLYDLGYSTKEICKSSGASMGTVSKVRKMEGGTSTVFIDSMMDYLDMTAPELFEFGRSYIIENEIDRTLGQLN